ncbi:MAG TPA: CARDB domain-containing protein [Candidatus Paceibacterota bacterium]
MKKLLIAGFLLAFFIPFYKAGAATFDTIKPAFNIGNVSYSSSTGKVSYSILSGTAGHFREFCGAEKSFSPGLPGYYGGWTITLPYVMSGGTASVGSSASASISTGQIIQTYEGVEGTLCSDPAREVENSNITYGTPGIFYINTFLSAPGLPAGNNTLSIKLCTQGTVCTTQTKTFPVTVTHTVTSEVGTAGGTVSPETQTINSDGKATFTISYNSPANSVSSITNEPNNCSDLSGDFTNSSKTSYTSGKISADCAFTFNFASPTSASPTVTTPTDASITDTSATLGATLKSVGSPSPVSAAGVCYATSSSSLPSSGSPDSIICKPIVTNVSAPTTFSKNFTGLVGGTTYYYRGYATNNTGTGYSPVASFVTAGSIAGLVNGVCATTHYNCSQGTSAKNLEGSTAWTWSCNGSNGGASPSCSESKSSSITITPDLTASRPSPSAATVNVAQTFTSTISNIGNASTGSSFSYIFQTAGPSGTGGIVTLAPATTAALSAGASRSVSVSRSWNTTGTKSIRVCADKSSATNTGTINEGTKEDNNCSPWRDVLVSGAVVTSGTLTGANCQIALNAGTCTTTLTLNINYPVSGATTNITKPTNNIVATGITPASKPNIVVSYPNTTFYLNHNSETLATKTVNATCASGSWNGTKCAASSCVPPPALKTATSSFTPATANVGGSINIKCDFGSTFDSITPAFTGASGCTWGGFTGTVANYTCIASQAGIHTVYCNTFNTPPPGSNYCATVNPLAGSLTVGSSGPNLTADPVMPNPASATLNTPISFSSLIKNIGTSGTVSGFSNSMQVATGPNGAGPVNPLTASAPVSMGPLAGGAYATATASYTFTGAAGTRSVRFCADNNTSMSGSITEGVVNESDNCSTWRNVAVSGAPVSGPDLTTINVLQSPTPAILNANTTFTANIKNQGGADTGIGFTNLFQTSTSSDGSTNLKNYPITGMQHLSAGATSPTIQKVVKFTIAGDNYVRFCADKSSVSDVNGLIAEPDAGHSLDNNNCSTWKYVPVPAPVDGAWSAWSACSATCGNGTQTRTCNGVANGGSYCAPDANGYSLSRACVPPLPACAPGGDPVVPACSPTHYLCSSATSITDKVNGAAKWTWTCNGTNGATASCTELKKSPTIKEN